MRSRQRLPQPAEASAMEAVLSPTAMAKCTEIDVTILKGSKIYVTVEEALMDVLVVSFKYGSIIFQGALLDVTKKNSPFGILGGKLWTERVESLAHDRGDKFHSLRLRHTYFQDNRNSDFIYPPLVRSKKQVSRTARDQSVRMRRLRPRQVLCSHCRAICNENSENVQIGSVKKESTPANSNAKRELCSNSSANATARRAVGTRRETSTAHTNRRTANCASSDRVSSVNCQTVLARNTTKVQNVHRERNNNNVDQDFYNPLGPVGGSVDRIGEGNDVASTDGRHTESEGRLTSEATSSITDHLPPSVDIPEYSMEQHHAEYQALAPNQASSRMILRKRRPGDAPFSESSEDSSSTSQGLKKNRKSVEEMQGNDGIVERQPVFAENPGNHTGDHCDYSAVTVPRLALAKTSPVIKISFANPQGKGTVVKIPARLQSAPASDTEEDLWFGRDGCDKATKDASAKAARKALKKAKKEAQRKAVAVATGGMTPTTLNSPSYAGSAEAFHRRKSRHHKHKVKRKRRHRDNSPYGSDMEKNENMCEETENGMSSHLNYAEEHGFVSAFAVYKAEHLSDHDGRPGETFYEEVKNKCLRQKLSISLKRLNAKAYMRCSPKYVSGDDSNISTASNGSGGGFSGDMLGLMGTAPPAVRPSSPSGSECGEVPDFPKHDPLRDVEKVKPLMMRISTHNVKKCALENGREMTVGDIVWGKIHGFPWWPGKVLALTISQRDNGVTINQQAHVAWFGSSTSSYMPCSQLTPFLDDFKTRYNKKKRGPYKEAIRQATVEAQQIYHRDLPPEVGVLS